MSPSECLNSSLEYTKAETVFIGLGPEMNDVTSLTTSPSWAKLDAALPTT